MTRLERDALEYPGLYAFGTAPLVPMARDCEAGAPFEARLKSVWPYIVRRARRFAATLSDRERANLEAEDLVQRITLALVERDAKWEPARGRYITFAERVIRNVVVIERERARVVEAPSNAVSRLRTYRDLAAQGKITAKQRETMLAIEGVLGETEAVRGQGPSSPDWGDTGGDVGRCGEMRAEVVAAIRTLALPLQAYVLARSCGLFDGLTLTTEEIAAGLPGVDAKRVRSLQARGKTSLRDRINRLRENRP